MSDIVECVCEDCYLEFVTHAPGALLCGKCYSHRCSLIRKNLGDDYWVNNISSPLVDLLEKSEECADKMVKYFSNEFVGAK